MIRVNAKMVCFVAQAVVVVGFGIGGSVLANNNDVDGLTAQDHMVTTIIDKSVIDGALEHDSNGVLTRDAKGNVKFNYTGDVFSIETNKQTGELKELGEKIGTIKGQAAFPIDFVNLSAGMNYLMGEMVAGNPVTFPQMPPVIPWTCNHCEMVVGDSKYVSIVDALDPVNGSPEMIAKFNAMLVGGAASALEEMRLDGRAFIGLTPASIDPVARTMSIRMAGCSAVVGVSGSNAGKMGTLCLNSTATFNVSGANLNNIEQSQITAKGTSNCVTVLHAPTL